jgi:hypothetical protein
MLDVVVDQRMLGVRHRAFDRVQLLREIEAGPAVLDHRDDRAQVSFRALQPLDDSGVTCVLRHDPILPHRI